MKFLQTPDSQFEGLADWPYPPITRRSKQLRHLMVLLCGCTTLKPDQRVKARAMPSKTVLCMHGEPSWSYLYRKMIPPDSSPLVTTSLPPT
ncbi:haloalkane dehalogenase [Acidimicrobiaceae bacterium]|nr:haloalkane dehalogenase [Acidimicrobiaceae bacterium]